MDHVYVQHSRDDEGLLMYIKGVVRSPVGVENAHTRNPSGRWVDSAQGTEAPKQFLVNSNFVVWKIPSRYLSPSTMQMILMTRSLFSLSATHGDAKIGLQVLCHLTQKLAKLA